MQHGVEDVAGRAARCASRPAAAHAQYQRRHDQDRRHERPVRHSTPTCRARARCGRRKKAIEDFCKTTKCHDKIEVVFADHQNKPDIGSNVVRQWYDVDKVDVVVDVPTSSVALAVNTITKEKNKVFLVSGAATSDLTGKACSAQHGALDLRHLGAGQRHRQGDRQDRRRQLVLPDRRLRLRPCAGARHRRGGGEERRQGGGQGAPSLPGAGLLVVPAAGAAVQGQDHRPRQRRRRHDQLHQAGGRVRHRRGRPEPRRPAGLHHRRARARPEDGAGPDLDRGLVLGRQRQQPRLRQGVRRRPTRATCRPWCRPASIRPSRTT